MDGLSLLRLMPMYSEDYVRQNILSYNFIEDKEGVCRIEEFGGCFFAHLSLHSPALSTFKRAKKEWENVKNLARKKGYDTIYTYCMPKDSRYSEYLGGTLLEGLEQVNANGVKWLVYHWRI